jgi:hypothetical protein
MHISYLTANDDFVVNLEVKLSGYVFPRDTFGRISLSKVLCIERAVHINATR